MTRFLTEYGDTEGPLGFPMRDADAQALDATLKAHPGHEYQRLVVEKATAELSAGERADVSWIQTEAIDRYGEIVLSAGLDDRFFKGNPIVTINHDYTRHPVGRSLWRVRQREGDRRGVKAKTLYPPRPDEWPADQPWPSDSAWALVKSGLMGGKSIGFLTLKAHAPTDEEVRRRPELAKVRRIVDEWALLEYSCCWLPVNPEAVVEATSKALVSPLDLKAFGIDLPPTPAERTIRFTPLSEVEKAIARTLAGVDVNDMARRALDAATARATGRV